MSNLLFLILLESHQYRESFSVIWWCVNFMLIAYLFLIIIIVIQEHQQLKKCHPSPLYYHPTFTFRSSVFLAGVILQTTQSIYTTSTKVCLLQSESDHLHDKNRTSIHGCTTCHIIGNREEFCVSLNSSSPLFILQGIGWYAGIAGCLKQCQIN